MPSKKYLTDIEKDKIIKFTKEGKNAYQISKMINRHHVTIKKYLDFPSAYGKSIKKAGRKPSIDDREKRSITRSCGTKQKSTRYIARTSNPPISHMTAWRCLQNSSLQFRKKNPAHHCQKSIKNEG